MKSQNTGILVVLEEGGSPTEEVLDREERLVITTETVVAL